MFAKENTKQLVSEFCLSTSTEFSSLTREQYEISLNNLMGLIENTITYESCCHALKSIIHTIDPCLRLQTILNVCDQNYSYQPLQSAANLAIMNSSQFAKNMHANLRKKSKSWTRNEDDRLLAGILRWGTENNWNEIAIFVGNNRTRAQCMQRWSRGLHPHISRLQWTEEEDRKLKENVRLFGEKSWKHISVLHGNRSDIQCRYRYNQLKEIENRRLVEAAAQKTKTDETEKTQEKSNQNDKNKVEINEKPIPETTETDVAKIAFEIPASGMIDYSENIKMDDGIFQNSVKLENTPEILYKWDNNECENSCLDSLFSFSSQISLYDDVGNSLSSKALIGFDSYDIY
ncbi:Myb-like DNA-binding domain containing protein [Tritrichomonas foetus]|uniref:Myb-like DNA-binding domain containing protein n=1 Tax=Tritrichomonas foetus TaxID=1144522 RepID=A0A1J4JM87_9EUKA|nr:Myb-like DNA-binding domain containing protein [Tritrichomonas foetus]|eukprot:OHS98645.1 Myb-like DNA-binding domain containing protein [Tritrichomonas foetus]